jgi:hypothetical protein
MVEPGLMLCWHVDRGDPVGKQKGKRTKESNLHTFYCNREVEGDEVEAEAEAERQESGQIWSVAAS